MSIYQNGQMLLPTLKSVCHLFPDALFCGKVSEKFIALTIDDVGDSSTDLILNTLASEGIKATFFVITSYLETQGRILEKIQEQGHEIGNHGVYDRSHFQLSPTQFQEEFQQAHQQLTAAGNPIKWFRPGRGLYNKSMVKYLQENSGYHPQLILASFIPWDTFSATNHLDFTCQYLSQHIFPGAIWVLHGGSKTRAKNTCESLKRMIPQLRAKGYQLGTLTELIKLNIN